MDTILVATSRAWRNGLISSSLAPKLVMNQVEWVNRKAAGQEYDGRSSIKDKGKDKVKELPKRIINILAPEKAKVPVRVCEEGEDIKYVHYI